MKKLLCLLGYCGLGLLMMLLACAVMFGLGDIWNGLWFNMP